MQHSEIMSHEYGVSPTVDGARRLERLARLSKIASAGHYVAVCRRIAARDGDTILADGRLVAVGWNHVSPRQWVGSGGEAGDLDAFLAYWHRAAERPGTVGSSYNPEPEDAYRAYRAGLPAQVPTALRGLGIFRGRGPCSCTRCATGSRPTTPGLRVSLGERLGRLIDGPQTPRRERCTARPTVSRRRRTRLIRAARAVRRTSLDERNLDLFSLRALEALGRLSPELQRVAIDAIDFEAWRERRQTAARHCDCKSCTPHHPIVIRVRDLPWTEVARVQRQIVGDTTGRVRFAYAASLGARGVGRRALEIARRAGHELYRMPEDGHPIASWLTPQYPRIAHTLSIRLVRGETPIQLSGGVLTKREAHDWLVATSGIDDPLVYLASRLPAGTPPIRSMAVVRWLEAVKARGDWSVLTRVRQFRGPGGDLCEARFLDRVDEIQDADLVRGTATGVQAAFESAAARHGHAAMDAQRDDHRVLRGLPPGWRLFRNSMRHLCTPAALVAEGTAMQHCVGGYADVVREGKSVILAIRVAGHASTVEITPAGRVLQHFGPKNTSPHPLCERVLRSFLARNFGE